MIAPTNDMTFMNFLVVILIAPSLLMFALILMFALMAFGKWMGRPKKRPPVTRYCPRHIVEKKIRIGLLDSENCTFCKKEKRK